MELISIVTPCYNEEDTIIELCDKIQSVFAVLEGYDYEHVIIDNFSTDNTRAILRLLAEQNSRIKVANPTWNDEYTVAQNESIFEDNRFLKSFGFSDQCYLIKTKDFKQNIYKENNPLSNRYPSYGGELFEKRVDSWMRNNNYYRITY